KSVSVLANDYDPDNNVPLALQSVTPDSLGNVSASISGNAVLLTAVEPGVYALTYTVADSLGATAIGQLSVTVTGNSFQCEGS
ncbi:hypothetical protein PCK05_28775, partial [Klebsiella pneumoniae]|uniref:Ig-like domain-containing protein n=2 Tax=Pseudomonadota TaxID=1224 RepID=UPI0023B186B2